MNQTQTTLLDILQKQRPESSKSTLRQMLKNDRVLVNGKPERDAKRLLSSKDRVEIATKAAQLDSRIRILFEDADLLVIEKAPGILTVESSRGRGKNVESLLNDYLGARPGEIRIHHVHRLDYDSSGVLVFAKNTFIRDRLKELFAAHTIDRRYVAIVHGKLRKPSGTFHSFLLEDENRRVQTVSSASEGKEAITHYQTLASGKLYSMLELTLETGRRNQIRVQLADAGHPILGDTMYGKEKSDALGRLALHAKTLGFIHPRSKKRVLFTAEEPQEFRDFVQ